MPPNNATTVAAGAASLSHKTDRPAATSPGRPQIASYSRGGHLPSGLPRLCVGSRTARAQAEWERAQLLGLWAGDRHESDRGGGACHDHDSRLDDFGGKPGRQSHGADDHAPRRRHRACRGLAGDPAGLSRAASGALAKKSSNVTPRFPVYAQGMAKALSPEVLDQLRVQERFDCWNRLEFELMEQMYAEDAVFDVSAVFTDVPPLRGKDQIRRYWHELRETCPVSASTQSGARTR